MRHCNLEMTSDCYGCPYYGTGDVEGCKKTVEFHKRYPNHTDEEYEKYMLEYLREINQIKKDNGTIY